MTLIRTLCLLAGMALLVASGCHSAPPVVPAPPAPAAATAGGAQIIAIAPPAAPVAPPPSIFDFLGVPQVCQSLTTLGDHLCAKIGMVFPSAEPGPPILPLTAAENFDPAGPPAVKVGAEIKAEQDLAAQKIKGLRYLATIGCGGCYPDVEHAILASLDDCTEAVRYEAVLALRKSTGNFCKLCNNKRCCSPAVRKRLHIIAYKMKGQNCYAEPSDRVRLEARLALKACGGAAPVTAPAPYMEGPPLNATSQNTSSLNNPARPSGRPAGTTLTAELEEKARLKEENLPRVIDIAGISAGAPVNGKTIDGKPVDESARDSDAADVTQASHSISDNNLDETSSAGLLEAYNSKKIVVRWERISAPFHKFKSRDDAYNALLFLRRKILSQPVDDEPEVDASLIELVLHPYTDPAKAPSAEVGAAIQALPPGEISPVIEDAAGFHLVRVLDRRTLDPQDK